MTNAPKVTIRYCTGCNWLLRAGWLAQELLSSFGETLGEVAIIPDGSGGVFTIHVNDELVWDRVRDHGFPDSKTLKQKVRDIVDPKRDMGHIDT